MKNFSYKSMKVKIQTMFKNFVKNITTAKEVKPLVIELGEFISLIGDTLQDPKKAEAIANFLRDNKKVFTETTNAMSSIIGSSFDILETMDKLDKSKHELNKDSLKSGFANVDGLALVMKSKKIKKRFNKLWS